MIIHAPDGGLSFEAITKEVESNAAEKEFQSLLARLESLEVNTERVLFSRASLAES